MTSAGLCSDQKAQLVSTAERDTPAPHPRHHLGPLLRVQPAEVAGRLHPQLFQHPGNPVWLGDVGAHDRSQQLVFTVCLDVLSYQGEIWCRQIRPSKRCVSSQQLVFIYLRAPSWSGEICCLGQIRLSKCCVGVQILCLNSGGGDTTRMDHEQDEPCHDRDWHEAVHGLLRLIGAHWWLE